MKLLKKILALGAVFGLCLGLGVASACGDAGKTSSPNGSSSEVDSSADNTINYVYRVSLKNSTGFGFSGATVNLMKGTEVVASKKTNNSGNANFLEDEITAGEYTIAVEDIPTGYILENPAFTYKTSTSAGTNTTVVIEPTGVLKGEIPAGTRYKLGDVIYDFTVRLPDGSNYTLSEVLKEKDMVLLNFWATWCDPCKSEFPSMHTVATAYKDDVSVLALSTTDDEREVKNFQTTNNYPTFSMASAPEDLISRFSVSSIPHSVVIDRYGVIAFNEVGSMPNQSSFISLFEKFVGEDYTPIVVGSAKTEGEGNQGSGVEQIKPTVSAPTLSALKAAFVNESASDFEFRFQEEAGSVPGDENYDEYNWPWSIGETDSGKLYIYASNQNIHSSYSILYSKFTAKAGDVFTFDYKVGTEKDADILYLILDGETIIKKYSGYNGEDWITDEIAYVFKDYEAGEHEISFVFMKDSETTANDDVVQLCNLRILKVEDIENSNAVSANIFRYAATDLNTDENATTQFKNYVELIEPGYASGQSGDEYYHVKNADGSVGPTLYANLMNASPWNQTSVWQLAYGNYVVGDGINFRTAIEEYAWEATQITEVSGYTAVTKDLRYLLDATVQYVSYLQKWEGAYHENEWLELCVYWEHYGDSPLPEDPLATITFASAVQIYASADGCKHTGECDCANAVSVPTLMTPRGFKYKFIPEKSGAYKVYSMGTKNTQTFLVDSDRTTHLGFWDNKVFEEVLEDEDGNDVTDENFEYYWYFEAGKTYYMLFTTYMDEIADYDVYIDYLGESYSYLENAAVGPYSANLTTFELFIPDAIEYEYADPAKTYLYAGETTERAGDGYYHQLKVDGSLGGVIYLDVNRPTALFSSYNLSLSLYDICRQAIQSVSDPAKRALYVNGRDYTEQFSDICFAACDVNENDPLYGFAAVDKDLYELLQTIVLSEKYDGIENSWLMLCYYYKTINADA